MHGLPARLEELTIRDVVLVERARLVFAPGLNVLTGETGAGKSILLDALGLTLGARADQRLLRPGAERAQVTAVFAVDETPDSELMTLLAEQDLATVEDGLLYLRRTLDARGTSRAFVNDQPVTAGFLRRLGALLVEVHGQHDERGLLQPARHRRILDAFGGLEDLVATAAACHRRHAECAARLAELDRGKAQLAEQRAYLAHAVAELDELAPRPGEETALAEERQRLIEIARIRADLDHVGQLIMGEDGADERLASALRRLERLHAPSLGEALSPIIEALARASAEAAEAGHGLQALLAAFEEDPERLEEVEERLFAIRALARKHQVCADDLAALAEKLRAECADLDDLEDRRARIARELAAAEEALEAAVGRLHEARRAAARRLEQEVAGELPALRLENARFRVRVSPLPRERWTATGGDEVAFEIATHPDAPFGPLSRIASGGELARIMLAFKVVLREAAGAAVMVFDEIDRGIGGATASAVGERLSRLARDAQVLLVTHSPQVAAFADRHFHIVKSGTGSRLRTEVAPLDETARVEELARMLAGATITEDARRAARSLLERHAQGPRPARRAGTRKNRAPEGKVGHVREGHVQER